MNTNGQANPFAAGASAAPGAPGGTFNFFSGESSFGTTSATKLQPGVQQHRESFKKGIDHKAGRVNREETSIQIRKQNRDRLNNQKRKIEPSNANSQIPDISLLPSMTQAIFSNDERACYEATAWFRKLLSIEKNPPIDEVIQENIVPRLVQLISQDQNHELQFEAAWALTNVASGTTDHTKIVIEAGAIPVFVQMLSSKSVDVREQAIWALGNIAGDSSKFRNAVLAAGALPAVLNEIANTTKMSLLRNATWTLSNFCRGKPAPEFGLVLPALPTLAYLVNHIKDEEVLVDAAWAISYLSDGKNARVEAVIQSGVVPRLVQLLLSRDLSLLTPALRTIGNIVTGSDTQTQAVIDGGALTCILHLLGSNKRAIVKEACWTLSNITAGTTNQIEAVIKANLIPPLIELLKSAEMDIRKEAAWAISNACSGGLPSQVKYIVSQGCIRPLCDQLLENELKIVKVALEGLDNILKVGAEELEKNPDASENDYARYVDEAGGLEKIEQLQSHPNKEVFLRASKIIETYFGFEGDDEEFAGDAPSVDTESNQFQFNPNPGVGMMGAPPGSQPAPGMPSMFFQQNQQGQAPGSGFQFGKLQ